MILIALILGLLLVIGLVYLLARFARMNYDKGHSIAWPFWTSLWGYILTTPFMLFGLGAFKLSELSNRNWESQIWETIAIFSITPFSFHGLILAIILQILWLFLLAREGFHRLLGGITT